MNLVFLLLSFIFLYLLPGYCLSRLFEGRLKNSPFFILFLSFLVLPILYTFLVLIDQVNLLALLILELGVLFLVMMLRQRTNTDLKINLDSIVPHFKITGWILILSFVFWFLLMSPRLGLWQGYFPVGDDAHQVRKVVSVAESPRQPLFYHFPTTRLTIYYFNNVAPGLWVKFTNNQIKAHQAWFIHVALQSALLLWLIVKVGGSLFSSNLSRFIFFWALTFFSGFEFFVYKIKELALPASLEWWSDQFLSQSQIHMQISNPFTLFFWVPQHLLAGLFVLLIYLIIRSEERNKMVSKILLALLWAGILGNSAFVFLTAAIVYGLHEVIELVRAKDLFGALKFNLSVVLLALVFSIDNLWLFLTAEKGHYLVPMANVFWFLPNSSLWGKTVNLILTVPIYYFVEFGILFVVMLWSLDRFIRDKNFREKYLFFYLFIFLLPSIFFVKALDDNNISMRAFIPAQIGLAIFTAHLVDKLPRRRIILVTLLLALLISLPTGFYEYWQRVREQFPQSAEAPYSFYSQIDKRLPLNSVVLGPYSEADKITALGHRFTFKDPVLFSATDREHTAQSQVEKYFGFDFSQESGIAEVLKGKYELKRQFHFYSLRPLSGARVLTGEKLFSVGDLTVYPVSVDPSEIKL